MEKLPALADVLDDEDEAELVVKHRCCCMNPKTVALLASIDGIIMAIDTAIISFFMFQPCSPLWGSTIFWSSVQILACVFTLVGYCKQKPGWFLPYLIIMAINFVINLGLLLLNSWIIYCLFGHCFIYLRGNCAYMLPLLREPKFKYLAIVYNAYQAACLLLKVIFYCLVCRARQLIRERLLVQQNRRLLMNSQSVPLED